MWFLGFPAGVLLVKSEIELLLHEYLIGEGFAQIDVLLIDEVQLIGELLYVDEQVGI